MLFNKYHLKNMNDKSQTVRKDLKVIYLVKYLFPEYIRNNKKINNPSKKLAKDLFFQRKYTNGHWHMKRCSISLVIRKS